MHFLHDVRNMGWSRLPACLTACLALRAAELINEIQYEYSACHKRHHIFILHDFTVINNMMDTQTSEVEVC
jgi:hypothetical protein